MVTVGSNTEDKGVVITDAAGTRISFDEIVNRVKMVIYNMYGLCVIII